MAKRFRTCDLDQPYLLPPSLQDWLPSDHLARFVADVTAQLDLQALYADYARQDGRGLAAYHPLMMTRLLLYAYCLGQSSSRRIEKATHDDLGFRYLAADQHPDHDTIAAFRQRHLSALAELFVQALRLCQRAGLVKLGNIAIDGTKLQANASTQRSVSYQRLSEEEAQLQATVQQLLEQAQRTDEEEDQRWGVGQKADPLPADLADVESRLEKLRAAKRTLEQEAQQRLEEAARAYQPEKRRPGRPRKGEEVADPVEHQKQRRRWKRAKQAALQPTRQYNFTDPDSRVMMDQGLKAFVQGYNAQVAADAEKQIIIAAEVTQQVTDREQLSPMAAQVRENVTAPPETITADAGYWDTVSIREVAATGVQVLVSPDGGRAAREDGVLPAIRNATAEKMRHVLQDGPGKLLYRMRAAIVEPIFAHIKQHRGFRRFALRGLEKVRSEWKLICLTHNLLKLFRHGAELAPA